MSPKIKDLGLLAITILLTLAFGAAGMAKLAGVDMMVATFETIGWGQWFRFVTGFIQIVSATLLWVPGVQWIGAGLLVCTMIAAVLFHILVLGPSFVPALVLGVLSAIILIARRPA